MAAAFDTAPASATRPAERLVKLAGEGTVGFELAGPADPSWLLPDEVPFVDNAAARRRCEFAGGRLCARRSLAALGQPETSITVGDRRSPRWPPAVVGSITHTSGYCAAVVAPRSRYAGLGIDVEQRGRVSTDIEGKICTEGEACWLAGLEHEQRADMATALFSAKEAFYKCQFQITGAWLGFEDASLVIDGGCFELTVHKDLPALSPWGSVFRGRFEHGPEHTYAAITIPAQPST